MRRATRRALLRRHRALNPRFEVTSGGSRIDGVREVSWREGAWYDVTVRTGETQPRRLESYP